MNTRQQIQHDVALISENKFLQSELANVLKDLRNKIQPTRNIDRVLAHAGRIDDKAAKEVTEIINTEFGKIDQNWE